MVGTLIFVRLYLLISPEANVYIYGYNVHHLYTGAFILVVLSLLSAGGVSGGILTLASGMASGLVIDQLVYLTTSKGGHKAYFESLSLFGMLALVAFLIVLGFVVSFFN